MNKRTYTNFFLNSAFVKEKLCFVKLSIAAYLNYIY